MKARRAEEERRRLQELLDQEMRLRQRLAALGRCPMGYDWIPIGGGNYKCGGGSHYVSSAEINNYRY